MAARASAEVPGEGPRLSVREPPAPLPRSFYARPATVVARDLLGRLLVRRLRQETLLGRIVECEAYQQDDPASHSFRGMTARTEVMFGPPGHLYVYFTYGMHYCMNVVTGAAGEGSAVLLRAVEPLQGLEGMRERRRAVGDRLLCAGPARLTEAFAVGRAQNGVDLVAGDDMFLARGHRLPDIRVAAGPRIGVTVAADRPWRFVDVASPFVSRRAASRVGAERSAARRRA